MEGGENAPRLSQNPIPTDDAKGSASSISEELLDVLLSIFDHCGLLNDGGRNSSSELMKTLLTLVSCLPDLDRTDLPWRDDLSHLDIASLFLIDKEEKQIMELEQCLMKVRTAASMFILNTLHQERQEIVALRNEFLQFYSFDANRCCSPEWCILIETIIAQFISQLSGEESMVQRKLNPLLDSIYTTNVGVAKAKLRQVIECLSRTAFLEFIPYLQAAKLLQNILVPEGRIVDCVERHFVHPQQILTVATTDLLQEGATSTPLERRVFAKSFIPSVIQDEVHSFLDPLWVDVDGPNVDREFSERIRTLLLLGSVGSGKTFICDVIEQTVRSLQHPSLFVIRPQLPMDLLQASIGETEDLLVSMFEAIQQHEARNVIVLVDDIEYLVGGSSADLEHHFIRRCRSTLFSLFDELHGTTSFSHKNVLFICTTSMSEVVQAMAIRYDRIINLEPPNPTERERLIGSYFLPKHALNDEDERPSGFYVESILVHDVVEMTVGKSYAELVQLCRQSMEISFVEQPTNDMISFNRHALLAMKERLQTIIPESLRNEYVDGYVDMRVLSARDLLQKPSALDSSIIAYDDRAMHSSPSASYAWKVLQSSIIIPLCKSKELHKLMDVSSNMEVAKPLVGAVLLTGESGSGKTSLALHCAHRAATLLPSVKLIDVTCTSLVHKEVGASEQAIHHLFAAARSAAPVIVLLDGIETIAATRGNDATTEGTMDRILSTLLIELDGIDSGSTAGEIAVIGITREASWIDPALKRPGRFDRVVHVKQDWI